MSILENHKFCDCDVSVDYLGDHEIHLNLDSPVNYIIIGRDDAIAMAKHFAITTDELENEK